MPTAKTKTRGGARREAPLTVADVRRVGAQAKALLTILDQDDRALSEAGVLVSAQVKQGLEEAARLAVFAMPSARALYIATFAGAFTRDQVLTAYHKALGAMHGAAPAVGWKLMQKMDDENAPGSTKVVIEIARGIGLLQPAEAVSTKGRLDQLDMEKLRERARRDPSGLKAEILAGS